MDKKTFQMSQAAHALTNLTQKYNQVVQANKNLAGAYQQSQAQLGQLNFLLVIALEASGGFLVVKEEMLTSAQAQRKRIDRTFDGVTNQFTLSVRDRTPEEVANDEAIEKAFEDRAAAQAAANESKIEIATSIPKP